MWWAKLPTAGGEPVDTVAEDMARLGFKDFQPPAWMLEQEDAAAEECGVLAENWQAVTAFLACGTQWRVSREGVNIGLRYEGVDIVLRHRGIEDLADAFWRVQVMERAALAEFAKTARRKT